MAEKDAETAKIDQQQLEEVDRAAHGIAEALGGTTEEEFIENVTDLQERMNRSKAAKPQDKK